MKVSTCQGNLARFLLLTCVILWTDSWPANSPQFGDAIGEVQVAVCVEGNKTQVTITKRLTDGLGLPAHLQEWKVDTQACWENGVTVYCGSENQ